MEVLQTTSFRRAVKKRHKNQKKDRGDAVRDIIDKPDIGEAKVGDLVGISVHKFKMVMQLPLLAYQYEGEAVILTLLAQGTHEIVYRDLKR